MRYYNIVVIYASTYVQADVLPQSQAHRLMRLSLRCATCNLLFPRRPPTGGISMDVISYAMRRLSVTGRLCFKLTLYVRSSIDYIKCQLRSTAANNSSCLLEIRGVLRLQAPRSLTQRAKSRQAGPVTSPIIGPTRNLNCLPTFPAWADLEPDRRDFS